MSVVTLTTEWQTNDIYAGRIKGIISSLSPGAIIIDNAFGIPVFDIPYASFVIRNTYAFYPQGSVHLICVCTESDNHRVMAVKHNGHYFIGTDTGIFPLILNSTPEEVIAIDVSPSRSELDVFAETAAAIISNKPLDEIGEVVKSVKEIFPMRATIDTDVILGSVIFIDSYGNAFTNITRDIFTRVFKNRTFSISFQRSNNKISSISTRYNDVPDGELVALFNQLNLLEIAINNASVTSLFNIEIGSSIRVSHEREKFVTMGNTNFLY